MEGGRCDGALSRPWRSRCVIQDRWPSMERHATRRDASHCSMFFGHNGTAQGPRCSRCWQRSLAGVGHGSPQGSRRLIASKSAPPGSGATSQHPF